MFLLYKQYTFYNVNTQPEVNEIDKKIPVCEPKIKSAIIPPFYFFDRMIES